jgi:hypothetical protein
MTVFRQNQPVTQADPFVKVEATRIGPLPVGKNRLQLVVIDDLGNVSDPVFMDVVVLPPSFPTAVLELVDGAGARIDPIVAPGAAFRLSGARSSDVPPGRVTRYLFTLVGRA